MTAPARPLEDDRSFLTDGRPYLTTAQAALYCGYAPTPGLALAKDPAIGAFHDWAKRRNLRQQPGANLYLRTDLDAVIQRRPVPARADLESVRRLARSDAADARRRGRLTLRSPGALND